MTFWEVKFDHAIYDDDGYITMKTEGPNFFETSEECMAYVLSQTHLKVCHIEMTQRAMGAWKSEIILNSKDKKED